MLTHYGLGQNAALRAMGLDKIAASRLDKEVLKGIVNYSDVVPHALGADSKNILRQAVHMGTQQPEEAVARYRGIQKGIYNNEHALAEKARALPKFTRTPVQQDAANIFKGGPDQIPMGSKTEVYAPETAGQQARRSSDEFLATPEGGYADRLPLPPRAPVDDTLNTGVLAHEKAERAGMRLKTQYPHATHVGVGPILEEDQVLRGDFEARQARRGTRMDPDNALVAKLKKQIGFHPDWPLPIGGRHQRALEGRLEANAHKIETPRLNANIEAHLRRLRDPQLPNIATIPKKAKGLIDELQRIENTPEADPAQYDAALKTLYDSMG